MKKKLFRERYNQDTKITAEKAIEMIDEAVEKLEGKKPAKKGKKNDKSNK